MLFRLLRLPIGGTVTKCESWRGLYRNTATRQREAPPSAASAAPRSRELTRVPTRESTAVPTRERRAALYSRSSSISSFSS